MIGDSINDALDDDDAEEETEDLTSQVALRIWSVESAQYGFALRHCTIQDSVFCIAI